ncbi:MAG: hypothetical protein Q9160_003408 [Pyrenula sp. 1 TL-2023]
MSPTSRGTRVQADEALSSSSSDGRPASAVQGSTGALFENEGVAHQANPEQRFWSWFSDYLTSVVAIAVLGGQITFTVIVSDIADPRASNTAPVFDKETVRLLIAISWLFFTCTLGLAVITKLLFSGDYRGARAPKLNGLFGWTVTFLLNFLPIGAFLLLALAAAAYVPVVGWFGTGFVSLFTLAVSFFWIFGW